MNTGIIVDGYSSGSELVLAFKEQNIRCCHVQSNQIIPDVYIKTFRRDAYFDNLVFDSDLVLLLEKLKGYNPKFVVAGSEPGVELADYLSFKLDLPVRNPSESSGYRRDKYLMMEQVKKCGLNAIKQYKSNSLEDLIDWAKTNVRWPVVMKPLKSAGGDRVKVCYSETDIRDGFHDIMIPQPNMLGLVDNEVLIQEYITGKELAINTVHHEGKAYFCEAWHFQKRLLKNGKNIYEYADILPKEEISQDSIDYVFDVANALNVIYGPLHTEIFQTKDNTPMLIESAARLMGANIPIELMRRCVSHPQAELTSLLYMDPEKFLIKSNAPYELKQHIKIIFLISNAEGLLKKVHHKKAIQALRSFHDMKMRFNQYAYVTKDYDTCPGLIYLIHTDKSIVEQDYKLIRELEKTMYEVY